VNNSIPTLGATISYNVLMIYRLDNCEIAC
jgi:hypothetical protein